MSAQEKTGKQNAECINPSTGPNATITRRKLWGILVGSGFGLPVGWLIAHYTAPWGQGVPMYHMVAGALAGAVMGCIIPGRKLDHLGWSIVIGTGCGSLVGLFMLPPNYPG